MKHISDVLDNIFDDLDSVTRNAKTGSLGRLPFTGTPTGFSDLDMLTAGFQRSDLIVVAGAPSSGKTSLALGMAYGAAIGHAKNVALFALDASADHIIQRVLSMDTGVDTDRLKLGQIDDKEWDRIARGFGRLSQSPIFIDDTAANATDIRTSALQMRAEHGLDLIILDPLELLSRRRGPARIQEMSEISRKLKGLARELHAPVVALAQIPEPSVSRTDPRPLLADLGEFGCIDEDADVILFVYREDKYEEDSEKKGVAEIIIAKHRNGPVGSVNLRFFDRLARFADLELYPGPGM